MKIDLIYLEEAKNIRKDYLNNLSFIVKREKEIAIQIKKLNDIKEEVNNSSDKNDTYYIDKINEIDHNINEINKYMTIYTNNIKELDDRQKILYNNIINKYQELTDNMKQQILNYVQTVDTEFIKRNEQLYNELQHKIN
jgi:hypothetical protein